MKRIQIKLHEIGTYDLNKISLSCFDDKRYVLGDGINTLAYPHKDIELSEYNLEFQGSIRNLQKRALFVKFYAEMP